MFGQIEDIEQIDSEQFPLSLKLTDRQEQWRREGLQLKFTIQKRKLTQKKVAQRCQISQSRLSQIINGHVQANVEERDKLNQCLRLRDKEVFENVVLDAEDARVERWCAASRTKTGRLFIRMVDGDLPIEMAGTA